MPATGQQVLLLAPAQFRFHLCMSGGTSYAEASGGVLESMTRVIFLRSALCRCESFDSVTVCAQQLVNDKCTNGCMPNRMYDEWDEQPKKVINLQFLCLLDS